MMTSISKIKLRGIIGITASMIIAILIKTGVAQPYPSEVFAYLACVAIGVWGIIDIIRGA